MYSTPKKRLFELKKELKVLKKNMDKKFRLAVKNHVEPQCYGLKYGNITWDTYEVITSEGKCYTIDFTTIILPDIDFRKIVYIGKTFPTMSWKSKRTGKLCDNKSWFDAYDSLIGKFNTRDNFSYLKQIREKYNVTDIVYTGLD